MEISPIAGIRTLTPIKTPEANLQPPAVFDIDPSAKPSDEREQGSKRKAAGAEENDEDDLKVEAETEAGSEAHEEIPAKQVDYFA
jgi:hypothetical protein